MNEPDDLQLRERLRAGLRADEDRAPDFAALWETAATQHRRQRLRVRMATLTSLAALLMIGGLVFLNLPSAPPPDAREVATAEVPWRSAVLLSDWQSPTDSLLPMTDDFALNLNLTRP